jgi:hypothetical protein
VKVAKALHLTGSYYDGQQHGKAFLLSPPCRRPVNQSINLKSKGGGASAASIKRKRIPGHRDSVLAPFFSGWDSSLRRLARPSHRQIPNISDACLEEVKPVRAQPTQQALEIGKVPWHRGLESVDRFDEQPITRRNRQVAATHIRRERKVGRGNVAKQINEHRTDQLLGCVERKRVRGQQSRAACCAPVRVSTQRWPVPSVRNITVEQISPAWSGPARLSRENRRFACRTRRPDGSRRSRALDQVLVRDLRP